jgi:hypothetical protein
LASDYPIGLIVFITRVIDRGGLGVKRLIKSLLILFVCWKKKYSKNSNVRVGEIGVSFITKQTWNVTIK